MKRFLLVILLFFISLYAFAREVRVGIYENKPLVYIDDKKDPKGIYIDLLDYIAKNEKWTLVYVYRSWNDCLRMLENDSIDVLVDIAFTEKRLDKFNFNDENVFVNWGVVYSQRNIDIDNIFAMRNKRIAGVKGDVYFEELINLLDKFEIDVDLIYLNEYNETFKELVNNKADFAVVNRLFGSLNESNYHIKSSNIIFRPSELRFATNKDKNHDLLKAIDFYLSDMKLKKNSILNELIKEYIAGDTIKEKENKLFHILLYLIPILIVFIVYAILLSFFHFKKNQKKEKLFKANQQFLLDEYPNSLIELDTVLNIKQVNKATCFMLDKDDNSLIHTSINDYLKQPINKNDFLEPNIKYVNLKVLADDYSVKTLLFKNPYAVNSNYMLIINDFNFDRFKYELEDQSRIKDLLLHRIPSPVIVANSEGKIITLNKSCMSELKITESEISSNLFIHDILGVDSAKLIMEDVLADDLLDYKLNSSLYLFNGEKTEVELHVSSFSNNYETNIIISFHNIEQEKQLINEAHYRNAFFKELFDKSTLPIVILDAERNIIDVNKEFTKTFSYLKEELLFGNISEKINLECDTPDYFNDASYIYESVCQNKAGERVFIKIYGNSIIIDGKNNGYFEIFENLSNYKTEIDCLRVNSENCDKILNHSKDIIFIISEEGFTEAVSKSFKTITGYDCSEVLKNPEFIFDHIFYEDRDKLKKLLSLKDKENTQTTSRFRFVIEDGSYIWLEENSSFIIDPEKSSKQLIIICRNVTAEVLSMDKLTDINYKLNTILNKFDEAIVSVDEIGEIKVFNKAFSKMLNFDEYNINHKKIFELIHIDNHFMLNSSTLKDMQSDSYKVYNDCEVDVLNIGRKKHYSINISKYRVNDGSYCILFILRDMSYEKKLQNEVVKLKNLEVLQISMLHLANDFNNILTAIMGHIALLKMTSNIPAPMFERILKAEEASIKAMELTHKIFPLENNLSIQKDYYSLSAFMDSLLMVTPDNIKIERHIPDALSPVYLNFTMTNNALLKIFENSCESMPNGGLIKINAEEIVIPSSNMFSLNEGKYLKLTFIDYGFGIDENIIEKIFDPYFSTKNKEGLGLTQAFHLLRNQNAYISINSEKNTGTITDIYLPLMSMNLKHSINISENHIPFRILFMDDEQLVLDIAEEYLKRLGFEITLVKNGDEVIDLLTKDSGFDVVILDLVVAEGMGARETIKKIREAKHDVKVFLSTGLKTELSLMDYKKYGFDEAIEKPIDFILLKEKIYRLMYSDNN